MVEPPDIAGSVPAAFLARIPEMLAVIRRDGRITWANPQWQSAVGLPVESVVGALLVDLVAPAHQAAVQARLDAGEELGGLRVEVIGGDGVRYWVQFSGELDPDGGVYHLVGREISEDMRTRRALTSMSERYALAMSSESVGLFDWDFGTGDVQMSAGLAYMHGLEQQEGRIRMVDLEQRWHPDDAAESRRVLHAHFRGEGPIHFQVRVEDRDGGWRYVRVEGRSVRGEDGQVQRVVGTVVDETPQVRALQVLRQQVSEARRAVQTKDEFLANVSHEIRTPLNAVLGMNELLRQTALDPHQADLARTVGKAGETLLRLIDDILDLAKVDAGRMELESIPVDLVELITQTAGLFRGRASQKGLYLELDLDVPAGVSVRTDPVRLRQVIANLCSNAIKFTEVGGVRIRVTASSPDPIRRSDLCIEIEDTGIGIPESRQQDIFSPFVQADGSTTRKYGGTGLGLTISRALVERLGGRLDVSSMEGAGTVFSIQLRVEVCSHVPTTTASFTDDDAVPEGLRVLVVEDNPVNQRVVTLMLRRLGCRVEVANDGTEAVARVPNDALDLVFMDVQMPGLDGYETTRRLRALGCDLPIIGLTAHAMNEDRARCLAAGMDGHETKPIRLDALRRVLLTWAGPTATGRSRSAM